MDVARPHYSLVVTNPNHLTHFLRNYHVQCASQDELFQINLTTLKYKFEQLRIDPLLLRFIIQRGVVPTKEMDDQRIRSNQKPIEYK